MDQWHSLKITEMMYSSAHIEVYTFSLEIALTSGIN